MKKLYLFICRIISTLLIIKHKIKIGKPYTINGILVASNLGSITCGNHLTINSGGYINQINGSTRTALVTRKNASIKIGNHCGISNSLLFAQQSITIDDYVMIGAGCVICDTDFHPLDFESRTQTGHNPTVTKPVWIKEGAFIGMRSLILKGVTIGKHSIVGAGSVVTKDIPDGEIWAGNPAKFIKKIP